MASAPAGDAPAPAAPTDPHSRKRLKDSLQAARALLGTAAGLGVGGVALHQSGWLPRAANALVVVVIVLAVGASVAVSLTKFQLWRLEPWPWRKVEALLEAMIINGLVAGALLICGRTGISNQTLLPAARSLLKDVPD
jgi:hypothetical protein